MIKNIEAINTFINKLWEAAQEFGRKKREEQQKKYDKQEEEWRNKHGNIPFPKEKNFPNNNFPNDGLSLQYSKVCDEIIAKLRTKKLSQSDLDSSLWSPHELWAENLVSLKSVSEIENFKTKNTNWATLKAKKAEFRYR